MTSDQDYILNNLNKFCGMRLLILGDIGLDEYVRGDAHRLSPEAPVPVLDVQSQGFHLGLSGNVAQNIKTLGGEPVLMSVVGSDHKAAQIRMLLQSLGISADHLVVDGSRPTTHKVRVMAQHHHLVRIDYEVRHYLSNSMEDALLRQARELIPNCAGVILQDYAKGVLSPSVIAQIVKIAHDYDKKVLLDPHRTSKLAQYHGVDLMTPNHEEAIALSGIPLPEHETDRTLNEIGEKIMTTTDAEHLVITLGKRGMRLFERDQQFNLPTYARQVFDVTGAGDTVISMLALAWLSGFSLEQACIAANYAAGVVVGKVGCVPCGIDELRSYIQAMPARDFAEAPRIN